ncbi:MAG TPA: PEGA domain-containing protein [Kofleriaceae bacterium]|nr:PEGA domain-containing protein [Kofleriaceae bacterium]
MGGHRVAPVAIAALVAAAGASGARAQPKEPGGATGGTPGGKPGGEHGGEHGGEPGGEIEIEPASTGPGSAARPGSAGAEGAVAVPAPPAPKDPRAARKWLAAAQQLMQKGSYFASRNRPEDARAQFENAVTAYRRSIEAGEDANVQLDLAFAEEKLGKLDEAFKHLRWLTARTTGVRPDVLKKANARLDELSARIGLVTLTVTPAGASVTLGGIELGAAPLPGPLVLMPGTYTLSFQADGFQPREAEVKVEPGAEIERSIELVPVQVIVEPVKPALPGEPLLAHPPPPPSPMPLYVGAGVTAAGVVGVSVFGILAVRQHTTFTGASTSSADRRDARDRGQRFARIADLSLGTGLAAAGFTTYWYLARYRPAVVKPEQQHSPSVDAKLDVIPWVQPRSGGLTVAGWF